MLRTVTVTSGDRTAAPGTRAPGRGATAAAVPIARVCPFVVSADGAWRSSHPARDQRCAAVQPSAPLALEKQARLCLGAAHASCATFHAAAAATLDRPVRGTGARPRPRPAVATTRWALVRTAPVRLDTGRVSSAADLPLPGRPAQAGLVALMVIALAFVVLARLPGEPLPLTTSVGSGAVDRVMRGPSPSAAALVLPPSTAVPVASPGSPPSTAPVTGGAVSPAASPTTSARPQRVYTVRSGDTLYAIALRHDTTVEAIQRLNALDSTLIKAGMELRIP